MSDPDEKWFDALAGDGEPPPAQARELAAIRRAAARLDEAPPDELARQRLFARLQREGLLDAPAPVARRPHWLPGLARAAVILLCFGLVLEWVLFSGPPTEEVLTAPPPALPEQVREKSAGEEMPEARSAPAPNVRPEGGASLRGRRSQQEESRALMDAAPLTLAVAEPAAALAELEELAARTDGIAVAGHEPRGEESVAVTLECADEPACARLHEALAALAENAEELSTLSPGQPRRWILERRGP